MPSLRVANLFLVGAPKAGTTSVASWLAQHPDVFWSTPKEPYFWATDYPKMRRHYGFDAPAAYQQLYSSPEARRATWRGDGSTTYLYSECAVRDIMAAVAEPRFVLCLRNPVELVSAYHRTQVIALNEPEHDLGRAWRRSLVAEGDPSSSSLDPKLTDYPLVGALGAASERLLHIAGAERVHAIDFARVAADPTQVYRDLMSFLGLDPSPTPRFEARNVSNKMHRSGFVRRLTHRPPALLAPGMRQLRQWSRTTPSPLVASVKQRMWKEHPRPSVSPALRAELHAHFADDVRRLEHSFDRSFAHWFEESP